MKYLGRFWNDKEIEIFEINGRFIALYGWNGEKYYKCFELDKNQIDIISKKDIIVTPIYKEKNNGDFELIDLVIEN